MRIRLREKYNDEELKDIYKVPHRHNLWYDHIVRVNTTIALAKSVLNPSSVADLSAGDAAIINALDAPKKYIGDYAPGYTYTGPIEKTILEIPKVDLFICSETLEHLDDPDVVLKEIRKKTKWLVLTTPDGENNSNNPEHYWGWNSQDVREMLVTAGFNPFILNLLQFQEKRFVYNYQMWVCE